MGKKRNWVMKCIALLLSLTIVSNSIPLEAYAQEETGGNAAQTEELADTLESEKEETEPKIIEEIEEKRDESSKHFLTEDRTYVAALYSDPVHYEKNGKWEDIDNTLEWNAAEAVYHNKASGVQVEFAQKSDDDELVSVTKGEYTISWELGGEETPVKQPEKEAGQMGEAFVQSDIWRDFSSWLSNPGNLWNVVPASPSRDQVIKDNEGQKQAMKGFDGLREPAQVSEFRVQTASQGQARSAVVTQPETPEEIQVYNQEKTVAQNINSQGIYEEILPNIDIQYVLNSNKIKENIILKDRSAVDTPIAFTYRHSGLTPQLEEDGSLSFYVKNNPSELVYSFAVPYMFDAQGTHSSNMSYQVSPGRTDEESVLRIVIDNEWLKSADRVYPVVIDPTVETSKDSKNIEDTFVMSGKATSTAQYNYADFAVGKNADGINRAFIRFKNLPQLAPGDMIYQARLYLCQHKLTATEGVQSVRVMVHEPTINWGSGTNWNNKPSYDSNIINFATMSPVASGQGVYRSMDITPLVRKWYNSGVNNGLMLKSEEESRGVEARFCATGTVASGGIVNSPGTYPYSQFLYGNATGLENHWSYHEQSLGRSGTGYTNDYNGNLVYIHNDVSTSGNRLPVTVSHVYNFTESKKDSRYGYGWMLSVKQRFEKTGIADSPYVYIDGDGTKHYFRKDSDGKYKDEDGLSLTLTEDDSSKELQFTIKTKDDTKLVFDRWYDLRKTIDSNGNEVKYNYSPIPNVGNYLTTIQDGAGTSLWLDYTTGAQKLTQIKDQAGRITKFTYDNNDLISITYPDGNKTTFTYSDHKLTKVTDPNGYSINYEYITDMKVQRVGKIWETAGSQTGQSMKITYKDGAQTRFEDCGMDGDLSKADDNIVTTYNFDQYGRPYDVYDQEGNANNYEYYTAGSGASLANSHKLSNTGKTQKPVSNYVDNPGIDNVGVDNWVNSDLGTGASYGVVRQNTIGHLGNSSIKVTKSAGTGIAAVKQMLELPMGTYTLSAYVKTENLSTTDKETGAALLAVQYDENQVEVKRYTSQFIQEPTNPEVDNGWARVSVSFHILDPKAKVGIYGALVNTSGTAYYDSFQLEQGELSPSKYNILRNPSFEDAGSGNIPKYWSGEGTEARDGRTGEDKRDRSNSARLYGKIGKSKTLRQSTFQSGKEGDVYCLSGWGKAHAIPVQSYGKFQVAAEVMYKTGGSEWYRANFNYS